MSITFLPLMLSALGPSADVKLASASSNPSLGILGFCLRYSSGSVCFDDTFGVISGPWLDDAIVVVFPDSST